MYRTENHIFLMEEFIFMVLMIKHLEQNIVKEIM